LLDLYPTVANLCGLPAQDRLQGKDISPVFENPEYTVRDAVFSVAPMRKGFLLRTDDWAYIQYEEDASGGIELFDINKDPDQYTNLALNPEYEPQVEAFKARMVAKLETVRDNDL
jgi:iduronate 2-sulfatase